MGGRCPMDGPSRVSPGEAVSVRDPEWLSSPPGEGGSLSQPPLGLSPFLAATVAELLQGLPSGLGSWTAAQWLWAPPAGRHRLQKPGGGRRGGRAPWVCTLSCSSREPGDGSLAVCVRVSVCVCACVCGCLGRVRSCMCGFDCLHMCM